MAVAFALEQVNRDHQVECAERLVEACPLRRAENRVAAVANQRSDLAFTRRENFVGEFGEAAGTRDRRKATNAARLCRPCAEHSADRQIALLEAPSADRIEAHGYRIQDVTEPLRQYTVTVMAHPGVCNTHRRS